MPCGLPPEWLGLRMLRASVAIQAMGLQRAYKGPFFGYFSFGRLEKKSKDTNKLECANH